MLLPQVKAVAVAVAVAVAEVMTVVIYLLPFELEGN